MEFRITNTFQDSLSKLTAQEEKAVKTTAFDLQMNPANPGLKFHRIDKAKDKNFWSVRANRDIRLIVHKTASSFLLCYVDHHDAAYHWAERRKIEQHPRTGATQIVEIRERIEEIPVYKQVEMELPAAPKPSLFADTDDEELLGYGVPEEWIEDVQRVTEDDLLDFVAHLPEEAAEALLELATGGTPEIAVVPTEDEAEAGFSHPDAQRRFRLVEGHDELALALEFPWEKWTVFLHPAQRALVSRNFNGPAKAAGSAGTGKTVVALHRAVFLAKQNPEAKLLLTTFTDALAGMLRVKLNRLVPADSEIAQRIEVFSISEIAKNLCPEEIGDHSIVEDPEIEAAVSWASEQVSDHAFSERFIRTEWETVVDAWQLETWEDYQNVQRLGRKTRLGPIQREKAWEICGKIRAWLSENQKVTWPQVFGAATRQLKDGPAESPFDFAIVDEAQDLGVGQLRFLAELCPNEGGLFFAGDLGQRIFQHPFSWKSLGVDIRGRSHTLKVNYRTSHQIRLQADRLLPDAVQDVDGNEENRGGTVSVFSGPQPEVTVFSSKDAEIEGVAAAIHRLESSGVNFGEIGLFVRSEAQLPRARAALKQAAVDWSELERTTEPDETRIALSTMHLAKGLEFRGVIVMACDDDVIPLEERIESAVDESDLVEVYSTERHLLYVACTRAREELVVTGVDPASEFLDDLAE